MSNEKNTAYAKATPSPQASRPADLGEQLLALLTALAKRLLAQDALLTLLTVLTRAVSLILDGSPVFPAFLRATLAALPMAAASVLGEAKTSGGKESDPVGTDDNEHQTK